jgi:hypothetical protein
MPFLGAGVRVTVKCVAPGLRAAVIGLSSRLLAVRDASAGEEYGWLIGWSSRL